MRFSSGFRKYFANTSWLFFGNIIRMVITLFAGIYVARYLGPSNFGLLSYATSFAMLFSAIATLGLDGIVVRELVKNESRRDELLGTAFFLKGLGALLSLGIIAVAVKFTADDNFTSLLILIIALAAIFRSFGVIDFYFRSKVLSKYTVYAGIFSIILSTLTRLLLIYIRAGLVYFAFVILIESAILAIGFIAVYTKQSLSLFNWKIRFFLIKELLRDSWPLILSGVAVSIYMRIDQVMIKAMMDAEAVGNYAVAVKLSEAWYFIPVAITGSVFPAIVNARKVSEKLYYERLQSLYSLMIWLSIGIALPTTFLANYVIKLLFGEQYQHAAGVLKIYVWSLVFSSLGVASGKYLLTENYTRISFLRTFVGMLINVLLNIVLIPRYGLNGAAIATMFSYFVAVFFIGVIPKTSEQAALMLKSVSPMDMIGCGWRGNPT